MELHIVHISNFKIDGGAMFGVVPKALWQKVYPADENNLCNWALRSLLIVTGDRRILIDNGYGDKQDEKFFRYVYLNGGDGLEGGLRKAGFTPEDITDMVLTHLHADHCGGGIRRNAGGGYEPVFPNATYHISRAHWEWATHPNPREKDAFLPENILPMQESGQLRLWDREGELAPGITLRFFHGHTRGQIIPFLRYHDRTIVFMADLIPSVAHLPLVWNMAYDIEPLVTLEEKAAFLREAYENQYILFFEHDLYHECCTLRKTPKGYRADKIFTLREFLEQQEG